MAKINYKYCEDKVLYDSGDIEAEMLKLYKEGKDVKGEHFFYSITPVRENIINWYPFKKNSVILEVGGGLGAITEPLCKVAKKVIAGIRFPGLRIFYDFGFHPPIQQAHRR